MFTGLLGSGYVMVVDNHQCNAANLNQSKPPVPVGAELGPVQSQLVITIFLNSESFQNKPCNKNMFHDYFSVYV